MDTTTDDHARGLMRLIRLITSMHATRRTDELDMRQRLAIQTLGLSGAQSLHGLGGQLGLPPSTMTGVADRLESAGYARRRDHTDRRVVLLELTAKGRRAFAAEVEWYRYLVEESLTNLGAGAREAVHTALLTFDVPEPTERGS